MNWRKFFRPRIVKMKVGDRTLRINDCRGIFSLSGLMFDNMNDIDGALIYANNVWMPFVRRKLDLLFLDGNLRVIEIQKAVPIAFNPNTWRIYANKNAKYCLEIKTGLIRKNEILLKRLRRSKS
jgi:uncharacterized membrane protein (UPF0127 family)